jgi:hypothetical protein
MSIEYLVREYYNEMYRIHTQPGDGYDAGDDLHYLTVHKHLDQDPLIQFREAFGWVDQSGAQLEVPDRANLNRFVTETALGTALNM